MLSLQFGFPSSEKAGGVTTERLLSELLLLPVLNHHLSSEQSLMGFRCQMDESVWVAIPTVYDTSCLPLHTSIHITKCNNFPWILR